MAIKSVRFFGPLSNKSGYGNAVRNFATAFSDSEVPTSFQFSSRDKQNNLNFYNNLNKYNGSTEIDFYLHPPPWNKHKSKNYKIGYFYWETDRLPRGWGKSLNQVNEIWVPCALVANGCRKAGYKGEVKIIPTPGRPFEIKKNLKIPYKDDYILDDDIFIFYSIFQWHFRKGYDVLLNSYYSAFSDKDNVALILKVNPIGIKGYTTKDIYNDIQKIKNLFPMRNDLPFVFLSENIIPFSDIQKIHSIGNCYVSPHRGEGWGMPIYDAMHAESLVLTTQYGGITEYLDQNSANFIERKIGPVRNMEWSPFYNHKQLWAEPSVSSLSKQMSEVYQNYSRYNFKIENAKKISQKLDINNTIDFLNKEMDR